MKSFADSLKIALCGLATTVLVVVANVAVEKMTGRNFFTFYQAIGLNFFTFTSSAWVVIPIGAICVGLVAASGYYFGSLYFNKPPTAILLVQMVVIAGSAQFAIYYLSYMTQILDDGRRVADFIPFWQYINADLTSAHYKIGSWLADTGEVGYLGYGIAAYQFIGSLVGGGAVYGFLRAKKTRIKKTDGAAAILS
ncbi:hypothetical protein [Collimonas sp.]|jgi:hypothetical protein|uniref:hypothetical protein n=1 Tax=Collimonas sp. TaxID=1963772 RepID=UPI002BF87B85|nr:hypothetical protein [Collimonas sp.]HWW03859.1 hypothetical protein [Collimonas sp.]